MDMTGMAGMSGMGGMDQSSDGIFKPAAMAISKTYWIMIAGVIAFGFFFNIAQKVNGRLRWVSGQNHN
jgi:hypothetical protein